MSPVCVASLLLFQEFALWYSMSTTLSYLISFCVCWQWTSRLCEYILCLLSTSSSEEPNVTQVLGLRIILAHKGCVLACSLRCSYLIQGFQLHIQTVDGWEVLLFSTGIWHVEMISQGKLPAEAEIPGFSLSWLATPSYPQVLWNTLTCSLLRKHGQLPFPVPWKPCL